MTIYITILVLMAVLAVLNAVVPLPGFNFFVPLFSTFMTTQQAITFITVYFLLTSTILAYVFRTYLRADLLRRLLPASFLGAVLGSLLSSSLNELALTIVVLCFVLYFFQKRLRLGSTRPTHNDENRPKGRTTTVIGVISGFLQGGGFGGGDVRNNYLYAHNLSLQEVRATTAAVGVGIFVVSLSVRAAEGNFTISHAWLYIFLVPIAIASSYLGRHITHKLNAKIQHRIIIGLMATSILLLIAKVVRLA